MNRGFLARALRGSVGNPFGVTLSGEKDQPQARNPIIPELAKETQSTREIESKWNARDWSDLEGNI